jgi:Zn-dependent peptidase ImmA (M78 family)/transcriptional regulator with XRE-family HTH domain
MVSPFVGERLRLARLLKGHTLQEVGEAVFVSRQYINQFESDTKTPSSDVLAALASFLQVTESFFHMPLVGDVKAEQCHFRKRRTTPIGVTNRVLAYTTILEQLVTNLHGLLELPDNQFDFIDFDGIDELDALTIEKIAEVTRDYWGLTPDAPIDNIVDIAESAGAVVSYFGGVSDKVDALSVNRKHPLIIRNDAKKSICRMRFDLAHEFGHLIMHNGVETGCPDTEKEADTFASAFLFPRKAFAAEFPSCLVGKTINWNKVYELKQRWKVSARAIIYRANFLGFIDAQQYRAANIWFSKTRQTKSERGDELVPQEQPFIIKESIAKLQSELGVNFKAIADQLGLLTSTLTEVTGVDYEEPKEITDNIIIPFKLKSS